MPPEKLWSESWQRAQFAWNTCAPVAICAEVMPSSGAGGKPAGTGGSGPTTGASIATAASRLTGGGSPAGADDDPHATARTSHSRIEHPQHVATEDLLEHPRRDATARERDGQVRQRGDVLEPLWRHDEAVEVAAERGRVLAGDVDH